MISLFTPTARASPRLSVLLQRGLIVNHSPSFPLISGFPFPPALFSPSFHLFLLCEDKLIDFLSWTQGWPLSSLSLLRFGSEPRGHGNRGIFAASLVFAWRPVWGSVYGRGLCRKGRSHRTHLGESPRSDFQIKNYTVTQF